MTLMELALKCHLVYFHISPCLCHCKGHVTGHLKHCDSLTSFIHRRKSYVGINKTLGCKKGFKTAFWCDNPTGICTNIPMFSNKDTYCISEEGRGGNGIYVCVEGEGGLKGNKRLQATEAMQKCHRLGDGDVGRPDDH